MSVSFVSDANAQSAQASVAGFDFMSLLPLVAIFVVFYFFLIRPQQKKVQQQKEMIGALRRGDRVITTGGIFGVISKVLNDHELEVEIAEGVKVKVARSMVADCVSKGQPVAAAASSDENKPSLAARATKAAAKPKPKAKVVTKAKTPANKK